tara:strand:- start:4834 stop:5118 length:285 start_codon:yes stop_codon:yes gene_type:complete
MGGWNNTPRGRKIDYCNYGKYPNKDYTTRQECIDNVNKEFPTNIIERNSPPNNGVTVEDKRSMVYKIWTKNKNLIMIIGALGVGYFAYKKFIKK